MQKLSIQAHFFAVMESEKFLFMLGATIFFGVLGTRNPALAAWLLVSLAVVHLIRTFLSGASSLKVEQIAITCFGMVAVCLLLQPDTAHAAGGFSAWAKALKTQLGDIYDAGIYAAYGVGLGATGVGVNNGIKKSKGDQQVTTASIFGYGLGGPVMMMLGYFADSAAETVGGSSSHMNKLPGGL